MTNARQSTVVMDEAAIKKAIVRMAHEVIERHPNLDSVVILGIQKKGVELARELASLIKKFSGHHIPYGTLDISFHRDDLDKRLPTPEPTDLPCDIGGRTIILVDDVLFSGRTVRAAFDALHHYGRPGRIQLAVLVDRGHRELPIAPDYVGKNIPTAKEEKVCVTMNAVTVERL